MQRITRLTPQITNLNFVRDAHHHKGKPRAYKNQINVNGIRYCPRSPEDGIPKVENPPKMFRIERIKPIKGNPYWERRLLREFGLFEQPCVAVVKNIPEINCRLWYIKHLIKITPISFPYGEPTEKDINYTFLKECGECVVIKDIESFNKRLEASEKYEKEDKLDSEVLKRDSRMKWLNPW